MAPPSYCSFRDMYGSSTDSSSSADYSHTHSDDEHWETVNLTEDQNVKPVPSDISILDLQALDIENDLRAWERETHLEAQRVAQKQKALSARVIVDDELAKISYWIAYGSFASDAFYSHIANPSCISYNRVRFYLLSKGDQLRVRLKFHEYLNGVARNLASGAFALRISLQYHHFDTLLFANSSRFWEALCAVSGKNVKEEFESIKVLPERPYSSPEKQHLAQLAQKIRTRVDIEFAIEKDSRIFGGRWSGLHATMTSEYERDVLPKPCTLATRKAFYHLPTFHQDAIREQLLIAKGLSTKAELRKYQIRTCAQLSLATEGKYTSFASLVSDDLLFSDHSFFLETASKLGLSFA